MQRHGQKATIGHWLFTAAVVCGLLAVPAKGFAQAEVSGVIGGLVGGDLNNIIAGTASIGTTFDNGPLYGFRAGWMGGFIGVEGSFVGSPSGIAISAPSRPVALDGKVIYAEGNALFFLLPGPVKPFLSVGAGWHSYTLNLDVVSATSADVKIEKAGWNFGGGLKINIMALTLRGDVRDHLTKIGPDDFAVSDIASELGFNGSETLHNVEISGSVGVRF
jgi:hypothetical protein